MLLRVIASILKLGSEGEGEGEIYFYFNRAN